MRSWRKTRAVRCVRNTRGLDNIYGAIEHFALAPFRAFSMTEKVYGVDGRITHLELIDHWNLVRDGLYGDWKYNPEARSTSFAGLSSAALPMEQFMLREVERPVLRIALIKFIRQNLANKDWDAFLEI